MEDLPFSFCSNQVIEDLSGSSHNLFPSRLISLRDDFNFDNFVSGWFLLIKRLAAAISQDIRKQNSQPKKKRSTKLDFLAHIFGPFH